MEVHYLIHLKNCFQYLHIFQQGFLLRKVSKFVAGTGEDAVMPIPVFYEPSTGKIVGLTLHPDLKEEYADDCI